MERGKKKDICEKVKVTEKGKDKQINKKDRMEGIERLKKKYIYIYEKIIKR